MTVRFSDTIDFDELLPEEPTRYYPVVLQWTEQRIAWIEAESEKDALSQASDATDLWESAEEVPNGDLAVIKDPFEIRWAVDSLPDSEIGPRESCPHCGAVAERTYDWALRFASHAPTCPAFIHRADVTAVYRRKGQLERLGYLPACRCGEPGLSKNTLMAYQDELPDGVTLMAKEEAAEIARAHVQGRPHSKNIPLGITDDLEWDPR